MFFVYAMIIFDKWRYLFLLNVALCCMFTAILHYYYFVE